MGYSARVIKQQITIIFIKNIYNKKNEFKLYIIFSMMIEGKKNVHNMGLQVEKNSRGRNRTKLRIL